MMPDTNTNQDNELGKALAHDRQAAGFSLDQLEKASGIDRSTIHRMEQGKVQSPAPQSLRRLAIALGTEVEDYFALAGYYTPSGLPDFVPYMRTKYGASPEVARSVEQFFRFSQETDDQTDKETTP